MAMLIASIGLSGCGSSYTEPGTAGTGGGSGPSTGGGGSGGVVPPEEEPDTVPPTPPTDLVGTPVTPNQISLTWSSGTDDVGISGYRVYRGGVVLVSLGNVNSHVDSGLAASTTYSYTVQAIDSSGNVSGQSVAAIVTTPAGPDTTAPTTPTGLAATAVSTSQINLSWIASTDDLAVTGYRILRNGALLIDLGNVTTYQNTLLSPSTTYIYTIRARDAAGNFSGLSLAASATTQSLPDVTAPTTPTNFNANAISPSQVNLSWTAATDNEGVTGYRIYRDGALVITLGNVTSYQNTGLTATTTYSYNVDALDAAGNASGLSAAATVTTPDVPDTIPPSIPANLTATAVSTSRIDLSWTASTDNVDFNATGYRIFRNGSLLTTVGNVTTFANTSLAASTTYSYTVRALDAAGNVSGLSNSASATTQPAPDTISPTTPTGLNATAISTSRIDLSWSASTDNVGVTGYRLYRNNVFLIALGNVTTFQNTGLTASTTYSYRVDAVDAVGNASSLSAAASATTQASGGTPGTPSVSGVSGTVSHGQSITIAGTSFGAKSHAGPMLYDDFDDASATNINGRTPQIHQGNLAHYSTWIRTGVGSGAPQIVRDTSAPKALSTNHARMAFTGSYWALYLTVDPVNYFTTGQEMYISYWYRYRRTGTSHPRQTKAWIAYPSSGSDKAYFSTAFGSCESGGWRLHRTEGGFSDRTLGISGEEVDNEWIRVESYLKQSAPSTSNGAWEQAVYRTNTPERVTASLGNAQMRTSSSNWTFWAFGGAYYDMCGNSFGTIDVDDFYMDSTRARVEVCNAATYTSSTRCELQVPTAWTDTSITTTLKRGYLSTGTAYVYVFNASGSVNASGHAVTIAP